MLGSKGLATILKQVGKITKPCRNCGQPVTRYPSLMRHGKVRCGECSRLVTIKCKYCGKEKQQRRDQIQKAARHYCSYECKYKDIRLEPCDNCGKLVHQPPSHRQKHIFCKGYRCRSEWQKKQPRRNVVTVNCIRCNKEIQKYQSHARGKKFFCKGCRGKKVQKICPQCNKAFEILYVKRDQTFCSNKCKNHSQIGISKWTKEQRAAMSMARKGIPKSNKENYAKPKSPEHVAKLAEHNKRQANTPESKERARIMGMQNAGENSGRWKGGITPLHKAIRASWRYRTWKDAVHKRDNYLCQFCGIEVSEEADAHHVILFSEILETYGITSVEQAMACAFLWDVSNGLTACKDCHTDQH